MLLAARHAPIAVDGICYGQSDVPTRLDASDASAIILEQLARDGRRIERVWSSPWERTRAPAIAIAERLGVPLTIDTRLSEIAFGEWEGIAYASLESDARFVAWMRNWEDAAPPGGERLADLVDRVRSWRTEQRARAEESLVVTHAGVIRALRADERRVAYATVVTEAVEPLVVECVDINPRPRALPPTRRARCSRPTGAR